MNNLDDIRKWLRKKKIDNYTISEDLHVTVHGSVNLEGKIEGDRLPIKFDVIDGYFNISKNNLLSLEGSPKKK